MEYKKPFSGRGSAPDPGGACSALTDPLAGGEGACFPSAKPHPRCRPFEPLASALPASPLTQNRRLGPSQHDGLDPSMTDRFFYEIH